MTFDAAVSGTDAATWSSDERLRSLGFLELSGVPAIVVVAAHPDDETLGVGGLIALAGEQHIPVTVIVATDGAASHPGSSLEESAGLRQTRATELRRALHILNPSATIVLLELADGKTRESRERLLDLLHPHLDSAPAGAIAVVPWRGDGHRDHRIVGETAAEIASAVGLDFVEYPIWMWHWGTPESQAIPWQWMVGVELSADAHSRKLRAIAEFRSQIEPTADRDPVLRPDFLPHFRRTTEFFFDSRRLSIDAAYFDALYAGNADPWRLASRWYETRKRSITVSSLPSSRYQRGLEIGCSVGMLTLELAPRCDALLAVDLAAGALATARERLHHKANVTFAELDVTTDFPPGEFDLIVVSEVGYYLSRRDLTTLLDRIASRLEPGGTVVLCHWRHPVSDYPLLGDEVHEIMQNGTTLSRTVRHEEADFLLEIYSDESISVAQQEGLTP
ncbi:PIG-L family deacetylase [Lacisediminihabitans sp. FW035]